MLPRRWVITYRAVQRILDEPEEAAYISRGRKKQDAGSKQYRANRNCTFAIQSNGTGQW